MRGRAAIMAMLGLVACFEEPPTTPTTTGSTGGSSSGSGSGQSSGADSGSTTASTTAGPICGDGVLDPGEACDGASLPDGLDCSTEGFGEGVPGCLDDCSMVDYSSCPGYVVCGDEVVGASEECDGSNLAGQTCDDFDGYTGPGLACSSDCTLDLSGCGACVRTGDTCTPGQDVCCQPEDSCRGLVNTTCCQGAACP